MDEIWKVIEGFEDYKVSNKGRIMLKNGKITEGYSVNRGYKQIKVNGIAKYIHRIVADAFIPNPFNLD